MEMFSFGILLGAIVAAIIISTVILTDEPTKKDEGKYVPTPEEIETVLYLLRISASNHEKQVIDYLIDKEGENNERN